MIEQPTTRRKIFTQSSRQLTEHNTYRIAVTDFGSCKIYEYTLAAGELIWLGPVNGLLIPVSGTLEVNHELLNPGQALRYVEKEVEVFNLYEKELVNFLVIESTPGMRVDNNEDEVSEFDINSFYNSVTRISDGYFIGKFSGRRDFCFRKSPSSTGIIVYVIEGAFEVAECLLEDRDGLLVEGSDGCEWEALSNDAIVLVVEQH